MTAVSSAARENPAAVTALDQHRQVGAEQVLRAARKVVAAKGLSTRLEDVAIEAGVSTRAVTRHFASRDEIISAAIGAGLRSFGSKIPRYRPGDDPARWLEHAMVVVHEMNSRNRALYYQLAGEGPFPPGLARIRADRHQQRAEMIARFTARCWEVFGGTGKPPVWLADVVAVQLSPLATQALAVDFARTPAETGRTAAKTIRLVVLAAVNLPDRGV